MTAILLAISVYTFWYLTGSATMFVTKPGISSRLRMRTAPAIGIALTTITTLALSRCGLAVKQFAWPLVIIFGLASVVVIVRNRERMTVRELLAFIVPLALILAFIGYPMIRFGFDWLSFSNDDMTNYSLAAQRYIDNAYFEIPQLPAVASNRDLDTLFWGLYAIGGERSGAELDLALASSIFRMIPVYVFMPFIVAGYLALVSAAGALVDLETAPRWKAPVASVLAGLAPLSTFGMFYQLLGQILGLALLATAAAFWLRPLEATSPRNAVGIFVVRTLVISGLFAMYPELAPILFLGYVCFIGVEALKTRRLPNLLIPAASAAAALLMLGTYALTMFHLVATRFTSVSGNGNIVNDSALFPYYLLPSGFSTLWGMQTIGGWPGDPYQSVIIVIGMLAVVALAAATVAILSRGGTPAAYLLLPLFALVANFTLHKSGFSLYKLAMYVQPFAVAVFVEQAGRICGLLRDSRVRFTAYASACFAIIFFWAPVQWKYLSATLNDMSVTGGGFAEIPSASPDHLLDQVAALAQGAKKKSVVSDTANISLGKIEGAFLTDEPLVFKSQPFFLLQVSGLTVSGAAKSFMDAFQGSPAWNRYAVTFPYCKTNNADCTAHFIGNESWSPDEPGKFLLGSAPTLSVLNRDTTEAESHDVFLKPYSEISNHLIQLNSDIGGAPSPSTPRSKVSLFQVEPDYFYPGRTIAALGRYLLFSVERPSKRVRMVLDVSDSLQRDGVNALPNAVAIGRQRVTFDAVGRGSARLISAQFEPQLTKSMALVGLDLGEPGKFFPEERTGLMRLFGTSIRLDSRRVVGFARNISLIDADAPIQAPAAITSFPTGLLDKNLFYAGFYEDGWMSEHSRLKIAANGSDHLKFKGYIPEITGSDYRTRLTATVDGRIVASWDLGVGNFDLSVAEVLPAADYTVDFQFERYQRLPGDSRIVGCKVSAVGFLP